MALVFNGTTNVISGVAVGGLPDGIVDTDMLAANAIETAKIADDAVTDAKQNLSGVAKAWVNFNGTGTHAIRDSFNVSSITDDAIGQYTVNFSTAMSNTNYCVTVGTDNSGGNNNATYVKVQEFTTSQFKVKVINTGAFDDIEILCFSVFGD